jgi:hypothetical protein
LVKIPFIWIGAESFCQLAVSSTTQKDLYT